MSAGRSAAPAASVGNHTAERQKAASALSALRAFVSYCIDSGKAEKGTDLFFALCRTPLASPLHAHAELAVDLINKPLASSELPALQGLSNEHQL